jgi:hypothetical protein
VEQCRHLRHIRLYGWKTRCEDRQEWRDQDDAHQPVQKVAGRQPVAGKVAAPSTLEKWIDGAAEVRA